MNPYYEVLESTVTEGFPAQQRIRRALLELMQVRPFGEIDVKEICTAAGTGRSTFYVYYHNSRNVLDEIEDLTVQELVRQGLEAVESEPEQLLSDGTQQEADRPAAWNRRFVSRIWNCYARNRETYHILLIRQQERRFEQKLDDGMKYLLWEHFYREGNGTCPEADLVLGMVSASILRALHYDLTKIYPEMDSPVHPKEMVSDALELVERRSEKYVLRCRILKTGTSK